MSDAQFPPIDSPALVEFASTLNLGHGGGKAGMPDEGQLWLTEEALVRFGLPAGYRLDTDDPDDARLHRWGPHHREHRRPRLRPAVSHCPQSGLRLFATSGILVITADMRRSRMAAAERGRKAIEAARAARAAAESLTAVVEPLDPDDDVKFEVTTNKGTEAVTVPAAAVRYLAEVLEALGDGNEPAVFPRAIELSTGEVASLLGVSRQYVVRLIDDARIPSRLEGTHRRVQLADALRYMRADDRRRVQAFQKLAEDALT